MRAYRLAILWRKVIVGEVCVSELHCAYGSWTTEYESPDRSHLHWLHCQLEQYEHARHCYGAINGKLQEWRTCVELRAQIAREIEIPTGDHVYE